MTFRYLSRREAAVYLTEHGFPCSAKTLAKYACQGGGPRYAKYGLRVLYRPDDLLSWALGRCSVQTSTSDPGTPVVLTEPSIPDSGEAQP